MGGLPKNPTKIEAKTQLRRIINKIYMLYLLVRFLISIFDSFCFTEIKKEKKNCIHQGWIIFRLLSHSQCWKQNQNYDQMNQSHSNIEGVLLKYKPSADMQRI